MYFLCFKKLQGAHHRELPQVWLLTNRCQPVHILFKTGSRSRAVGHRAYHQYAARRLGPGKSLRLLQRQKFSTLKELQLLYLVFSSPNGLYVSSFVINLLFFPPSCDRWRASVSGLKDSGGCPFLCSNLKSSWFQGWAGSKRLTERQTNGLIVGYVRACHLLLLLLPLLLPLALPPRLPPLP